MKHILWCLIFVGIVLMHTPARCDDTNKYTCQADADCINSCINGAVSLKWYEMNFSYKKECKDGCDYPLKNSPRCLNHVCTAFSLGQYDPSCMHGPKPDPANLLKLTKFSCFGSEDCQMSCAHGAVNKQWYKSNGLLNECKDGCAADGYSATCQNHVCQAFYEGRLQPSCTEKKE